MNEDEIIAAILQDVEVSNYDVDPKHVADYMATEGFNEDDIVVAVLQNDRIEPTPERHRWLFCGSVPALRLLSPFIGRWLHVSVEYIEEDGTTIVTAYRPKRAEWITERERR